MPARLRIELDATELPPEGPPAHTGPAVHAAVLATIAAHDPELAAALHDTPPPKPLALTALYPHGRGWAYEVGVARDDLIAPVTSVFEAPDDLRIGRSRWTHRATAAQVAPYAELRDTARPLTWFCLEARSPTAVRISAGGSHRSWPLPLPDVLFGRLWDRWHRFAPAEAALPAATADVIEHGLAVSGVRIETASHVTKAPSGRVVGFVGRVELAVVEARRYPPDALAGLAALVRYATFVGLGDQTAKGMGWVQDRSDTRSERGADRPARRRRRPSS